MAVRYAVRVAGPRSLARRVHVPLTALAVAGLWGASCTAQAQDAERRSLSVFDARPHDPNSYTQGFLLHEGALYESGGRYGLSDLREADPLTGEVRRSVPLDEQYFAEGLARVDDRLIQLTWQENVAFIWSIDTFEPLGEFSYETQGWGLCNDGTRLVMSDGTDELFFRDPETFALLDTVTVTLDGEPLSSINELECVEGRVYANVWRSDDIVVIDPGSGRVETVFDGSVLRGEADLGSAAEVLNGIAFDPETRTFWVTGKLWAWMFEVDLGLLDAGETDGDSDGGGTTGGETGDDSGTGGGSGGTTGGDGTSGDDVTSAGETGSGDDTGNDSAGGTDSGGPSGDSDTGSSDSASQDGGGSGCSIGPTNRSTPGPLGVFVLSVGFLAVRRRR